MAFSAKRLESCGKAVAWGLSEAPTRASNGKCALDLEDRTSPTSRATSTRLLGAWACPRPRGGTQPPSRHQKFAHRDPAAVGPRKSSPSTPPPPAFPRKCSPSTPQTAGFGLFFVRWANFVALASTIRPSRAKIVTHRARKHERLERKIAPARGVKGRRETFFAHARSQEPFLAHFNRAGATFLSLRMHAKHWSNPLGRYFFQDQTKTTD